MRRSLLCIGFICLLFCSCPRSFVHAEDQNGKQTVATKLIKGSATTPAGKMLKAIPFQSPELVKKSDAALIAATKNGKGEMPEFGTELGNSQINEVVEYIRTLQKRNKRLRMQTELPGWKHVASLALPGCCFSTGVCAESLTEALRLNNFPYF